MNGGATIVVEIELYNHVWANSDGDASASIFQFGFLANDYDDVISITCS